MVCPGGQNQRGDTVDGDLPKKALPRDCCKIEKAQIEQCHCKPVRRLVWYPKGISFGHNPPDFQTSTIENPGFYSCPGDCHTSDIGHWFAMTSFRRIEKSLRFDCRKLFLCFGMTFLINALDFLVDQVGIHLGRRDVAVAHKLLQGAEISAVFQQVHCKTVA